MLAALLLGTTVNTATGKPAGGTFANVPACQDAEQSGCVVSYGSYAGTPPANGIFGRSAPGRPALCVSPAALLGRGEELTSLLPTAALSDGEPLVEDAPDTGFVTLREAVQGRCRSTSEFGWLDVTIAEGLAQLPQLTGQRGDAWGLHRVDVNLALGDLVDLVDAQSQAWQARGGPSWDR